MWVFIYCKPQQPIKHSNEFQIYWDDCKMKNSVQLIQTQLLMLATMSTKHRPKDDNKGLKLTTSLKTPGLKRFVSLAAWNTSAEPSASSCCFREDRAQNIPAGIPPTLKTEKNRKIHFTMVKHFGSNKSPNILQKGRLMGQQGLTHHGPPLGSSCSPSLHSPGW